MKFKFRLDKLWEQKPAMCVTWALIIFIYLMFNLDMQESNYYIMVFGKLVCSALFTTIMFLVSWGVIYCLVNSVLFFNKLIEEFKIW